MSWGKVLFGAWFADRKLREHRNEQARLDAEQHGDLPSNDRWVKMRKPIRDKDGDIVGWKPVWVRRPVEDASESGYSGTSRRNGGTWPTGSIVALCVAVGLSAVAALILVVAVASSNMGHPNHDLLDRLHDQSQQQWRGFQEEEQRRQKQKVRGLPFR